NLKALLAAGRAAGAAMAESNVLFLRSGTRETFFAFLRAEFPRLVPEYERLYARGAYAPASYVAEIEARVRRLGAAAGFPTRRRRSGRRRSRRPGRRAARRAPTRGPARRRPR